MGRLDGKIAIVTGIGAGIGRETALLFASEGAIVIGADLDSKTGEEVIGKIESDGGQAAFLTADVSKAEDVRRLVEEALDFKRVDILFNNAGVEVVKRLVDTSEQEWDRSVDVNLKSVYLCCKQVIPHMISYGGGSIINNSSVAGLVGSFSPAYSAAKGGIISLTRTLAIELASDNIRVNCICPGAIETPMLQRTIEKQGNPDEIRKERISSYPMGRFGEPEEVAYAALYLASDESSFLTGVILPVDGGFTAI